MAFPRRSASMLLASLILLLCWTTSSARSRDSASSDLSPSQRLKRDLDFETREKVGKTFEVMKEALSAITEVEKVKDVMKKLSNFAIMAPGIGTVLAAINVALAFISQDDPVLNAVKDGFAEVNKKLDSLSIQISNLATDVEWFNYVSVYSQDEVRILNAWNKVLELQRNSKSARSEDDRTRLVEIFTNYYEYTGTEASVANLFHYLTVSGTSLSRNLNELLKNKFKCDVREMAKYNIYFYSLLLKGIALNEAYWRLIGLNPLNKEAEHAEMFRDVYRAQQSAVQFCLSHHQLFVKSDVEEVSKKLSHDDKQAVAVQVKKTLDEKYDWYDWVVLVYNTEEDANYLLHDLTKIPVGKITVAVGSTLTGDDRPNAEGVKMAADSCFTGQSCPTEVTGVRDCKYTWQYDFYHPGTDSIHINLADYVRATHVTYGSEFAEVPRRFHQTGCSWGRSTGQLVLHFSRSSPVCGDDTCQNRGTCRRLLDSNDWLCECPLGYYGNTCETQLDTSLATEIGALFPVTAIASTSSRLKAMEAKLKEIVTAVHSRCG